MKHKKRVRPLGKCTLNFLFVKLTGMFISYHIYIITSCLKSKYAEKTGSLLFFNSYCILYGSSIAITQTRSFMTFYPSLVLLKQDRRTLWSLSVSRFPYEK